MPITFILLAAAIGAAWLPSVQVGRQSRIALWPFLFVAAILSGLAAGTLTWAAIVGLGMFVTIAALAARPDASRLQKIIFGLLTAVFTLALAMHSLPGFSNPALMEKVQVSANAAPFTLHANFDTASAGLILLAFFCHRARSLSAWGELLRRTAPIALVTVIGVIGAASALGYIQPDVKLPAVAPLFLVTNLLFTSVTEEAFFRGFLQDRLTQSLAHLRLGGLIAIASSAALFGIAHARGGPILVLLAMAAGVGYGYAYCAARRIEAAILTHFGLNAVHFVAFTYPSFQPTP